MFASPILRRSLTSIRHAGTQARRATAHPAAAVKAATNSNKPRSAMEGIYLPDMEDISRRSEVPDEGVAMPSEPDNYTRPARPSTSTDSSHSSFTAPKIQTVASPSTHIEGGPLGGSGADDVQEGQAGDSTKALPKESDISQVGVEEVVEKSGSMFEGLFAGAKGGKQSKDKAEEKEYEFVERDLNKEEVNGLYTLGGIVVGGLIVGEILKPRK